MKIRTQITALLMVAGAMTAEAATPAFLYEATVRTPGGQALVDREVDAVLTILDGENRTVYSETHHATTDDRGVMQIAVGTGETTSGNFDSIDWSGKLTLKSDLDCGRNATASFSEVLGAAPMALYAESATHLVSETAADGSHWELAVDNDGSLSTVKIESAVYPIPEGYTMMIFHDEFNGTGLPDSKKWRYEHGYVRNGEKQFYTEARPENCYQEDGLLHLVCRKDNYVEDGQTHAVTSASIHTRDIMKFTYGRVDVYAKLPCCLGSWPAIWMMPNDDVFGFWPNSGEIDIMEHVGYDPNKVYFTAHCYEQNSDHNQYHSNMYLPTSFTEFHLYSFVWKNNRLEWWIDGKRRFIVSKDDPKFAETTKTWRGWPYTQDFYLILNLAFGGGWGGQKGIDLEALPIDYQIDYVRIYQ